MLNEVGEQGSAGDLCMGQAFVELINPTSGTLSLVGLVLSTGDRTAAGALTLGASGCPQSMATYSLLAFCKSGAAYLHDTHGVSTTFVGCGISFDVGTAATISLYPSDTSVTTPLDATPACCAGDSTKSYGRHPSEMLDWVKLPQRTPADVNVGYDAMYCSTHGDTSHACCNSSLASSDLQMACFYCDSGTGATQHGGPPTSNACCSRLVLEDMATCVHCATTSPTDDSCCGQSSVADQYSCKTNLPFPGTPSGPSGPSTPTPSTPVGETVTVSSSAELQQAVLGSKAKILISPGTYTFNSSMSTRTYSTVRSDVAAVVIERSLVLEAAAAGEVILDGGGNRRVIAVMQQQTDVEPHNSANDIHVELRGLRIFNGCE